MLIRGEGVRQLLRGTAPHRRSDLDGVASSPRPRSYVWRCPPGHSSIPTGQLQWSGWRPAHEESIGSKRAPGRGTDRACWTAQSKMKYPQSKSPRRSGTSLRSAVEVMVVMVRQVGWKRWGVSRVLRKPGQCRFDRRRPNRRHRPDLDVIRLRVWPTAAEEAQSGLDRLLKTVPQEDWFGSLIIVGDPPHPSSQASR